MNNASHPVTRPVATLKTLTVYFYKPSGARAAVHSYTKSGNDRDGNGHITFHG
ncbi:hypothetical protein GCM10010384_54750 [Streptomyces djakartensis]|uniref:Uncharacterized protein n=1 Tax=Streptomyces djakartensis TaxID=68193 RepID=A0ABQ3A8K1_9ACTN|nr:hypothetical protein GCM10010384_54750 [Streptomyces djakartensis]